MLAFDLPVVCSAFPVVCAAFAAAFAAVFHVCAAAVAAFAARFFPVLLLFGALCAVVCTT